MMKVRFSHFALEHYVRIDRSLKMPGTHDVLWNTTFLLLSQLTLVQTLEELHKCFPLIPLSELIHDHNDFETHT